MLHLFLFVANARGQSYGVGSYINSMEMFFKEQKKVCLSVVYINNDCTEFQIEKRGNITYYYIPAPIAKPYEKYGKKTTRRILYLLQPYIPSNSEIYVLLNFSESYLMKSISERFKCHVIYTVHYFKNYFAHKGNKKKIVEDIERLKNNEKDTILRHDFEKDTAEAADHIIAVTEDARQLLINNYEIPKEKITTVYNGVNTQVPLLSLSEKQALKKSLGYEIEDEIVLYSGRLDEGKGIKEIVQNFGAVLAKVPKARLVLVGDGDFKNIIPNNENLWRQIDYTNFISQEKLFELYQIASVGILPSWFEWCSYTALEMMSFGLPIVTSNAGGLDEIFEHDFSALKIPLLVSEEGDVSNDTNLWANSIIELLTNKEKATFLGQNAKKVVDKKFSVERMMEQTIAVCREQLRK